MLKEGDLNGMLRRYEDNQKKHQVRVENTHDHPTSPILNYVSLVGFPSRPERLLKQQ
jgi:hypothetical protein